MLVFSIGRVLFDFRLLSHSSVFREFAYPLVLEAGAFDNLNSMLDIRSRENIEHIKFTYIYSVLIRLNLHSYASFQLINRNSRETQPHLIVFIDINTSNLPHQDYNIRHNQEVIPSRDNSAFQHVFTSHVCTVLVCNRSLVTVKS